MSRPEILLLLMDDLDGHAAKHTISVVLQIPI